ncbi:putative lipid II flippase FtsW [Candidatus Uhrbacteria bacterium]|nr:putative lipid II flippase FtsW [Candidatus Uhrbacteria bacterium]
MFRRTDYILATIFLLLILFGLVMLSSAGSYVGFQKFQDSYYYVKHQLLSGILPGIFAFFLFYLVDYRRWRAWVLPLFVVSLALLALVLIPGFGVSYGRTQSWLNLGGFSFQPVEFMKLALILFFAAWLEGELLYGGKEALREAFWPFVVRLGIVGGLVALQPDIGTLGMIIVIAFVQYIIAGAPWKHIMITVVAALGAFVSLVVVAPYRLARVLVFLDTSSDPQGAGYHIQQALLSIGSGGIFGVGLGQSRQKLSYLPEVVGDSIFAVIAEELGFIVAALVVITFLVILVRGFRIAARAPDDFGKFIAAGIVVWIVGQAFLNMGAMLGILPLTGLPLPFLSYGGTSMVMTLAAAGLLLNIAKQS